MPWSMKVILFFLSSVLVVSCSNEKTKAEDLQKQALHEFIQFVDQWKEGSIRQNALTNRISTLNDLNQDIIVFNEGNDIDKQSILFQGSSDTLFVDHLNYLTTTFGAPSQSASYKVWRLERASKNTLEISFYPHPTENWLLALRERGQE